MKILFSDIFQDIDKNAKVKFNQWGSDTNDPMEEYKRNPSKINDEWFLWHKKQRYFSVGQTAICLLKLSKETWLLTTIKKITNLIAVGETGGVGYEADEIEKYKSFFGRVIVKYPKNHQAQGRWFSEIENQLEVVEVLPTMYDGEDFPGYDKICLSWRQLETIILREKRDWIKPLENQKAVYLITDISNGKQYVGSATGENGMLLQRWRNYIVSGHGGNIGLKEIPFNHVKEYFQYSILENYNARVDKNIILLRESWWKEVLQTRKFGYNKN